MADRPVESRWLYNQPTPGVVAEWFQRNQSRIKTQIIEPRILDGALVLASTAEGMDSTQNFRYAREQVVMTADGPEKPAKGSELWTRWQTYQKQGLEARERDGEKFSVHSYSPFLSDNELRIRMSEYSWFRMQALNNQAIGSLPEVVRDDILPTRRPEGFVFEGELPSYSAVFGVLITADNHLVLTTRAQTADYYKGTVSPSFEEQMDRSRDQSPFDTFERAVAYSPKLKLRGEELRLTIRQGRLRLVSIVQEPAFNSVGFVIIGRCEEEAGEIDETKLGVDRAEFDPSKPIWTLPLEDPTELIQDCFDFRYNWHGVGRHRVFEALASIHGYDAAADLFYTAYLQQSNR